MGALVVACLLTRRAAVLALTSRGLASVKNVSAAAIASQLSVPFTTLLSVALLGEVVRWRRWTGVLLSFGGVFIMGFDSAFRAWVARPGARRLPRWSARSD